MIYNENGEILLSKNKNLNLTDKMINKAITYFKSNYSKIFSFTKTQLSNLIKQNDLLDKSLDKYFKIFKFNEEDGWDDFQGRLPNTLSYDDSVFVSPDNYKTHWEWSKNIYRWWFSKDLMLMCKLEEPFYDPDNIEYEEEKEVGKIQGKLIEILFTEVKKYKHIYAFEVDDVTGIYIGLRLSSFFE